MLTLDRFNRRLLLDEPQLQPPSAACPFCGQASLRRVGALQSNPPLFWLGCTHCALVSASRLPRPEVLQAYYRDYYPCGQPATTTDEVGLARHLSRTVRQASSVLDFGGGDGSVALQLQQRLGALGGVAVVDFSVEHAPGVEVYRSLDELQPERRFQVVLASAVLEHVLEPRALFEQLLLRLAPGGIFYARTPYMIAFERLHRALGGKGIIPYPGHLFDMGRDFWDRSLQVLGWQTHFRILSSSCACVESNPRKEPLKWLLSSLLKWPSRYLRNHYPWVGGWEIFIQRTSADDPATPRYPHSTVQDVVE